MIMTMLLPYCITSERDLLSRPQWPLVDTIKEWVLRNCQSRSLLIPGHVAQTYKQI